MMALLEILGVLLAILLAAALAMVALVWLGYMTGRWCARLPVLTLPAAVGVLWCLFWPGAEWMAAEHYQLFVLGNSSAEANFLYWVGFGWWPLVLYAVGLLSGLCVTYGAVAVPAALAALAVGTLGWGSSGPATGGAALAPALWLLPVAVGAGRLPTRVLVALDRRLFTRGGFPKGNLHAIPDRY